MPTFSTNGLAYHYVEAGEGPAVLLLHGFTGSGENWQRLLAALADGYRTIALDLPGHGQSEAPADPGRYGMATVAADIGALLAHLGCGPAHLLGYSMGGRLALYLALTAPARWRSLILESASPGLATTAERVERQARDEALAAWIEAEGIEAFVDRWEGLPLFASQQRLPEGVRQAHRAGRLRNRPQGLANSLRGMGTGVQPSLWALLAKLTLPTLLIAGALDEKFVGMAQRMAALLAARPPHPRLEIVADAGHTVHLERPDVYANLVREWVATH